MIYRCTVNFFFEATCEFQACERLAEALKGYVWEFTTHRIKPEAVDKLEPGQLAPRPATPSQVRRMEKLKLNLYDPDNPPPRGRGPKPKVLVGA